MELATVITSTHIKATPNNQILHPKPPLQTPRSKIGWRITLLSPSGVGGHLGRETAQFSSTGSRRMVGGAASGSSYPIQTSLNPQPHRFGSNLRACSGSHPRPCTTAKESPSRLDGEGITASATSRSSISSHHLGYHRFRGEPTQGESTYPHLDPVHSPFSNLKGSFPSFSPDSDFIAFNHDFDSNGGVKIILVGKEQLEMRRTVRRTRTWWSGEATMLLLRGYAAVRGNR